MVAKVDWGNFGTKGVGVRPATGTRSTGINEAIPCGRRDAGYEFFFSRQSELDRVGVNDGGVKKADLAGQKSRKSIARDREYEGPYPRPGQCEVALALATRIDVGFGAAVATVSPIEYSAALKMDAAEAIGLLHSRIKLQSMIDRAGDAAGTKSAPTVTQTELPGGKIRVRRSWRG